MGETSEPTVTSTPHSRAGLLFLLFTALVCGALIMVVEVLGSRVIGPFFGVSLFVWTSLITVTLVALALGYAVGGQLADRRGTAEILYGIILLAGVAVLLIPLYKLAVLKLCVPLGLRLGAFVSTSLLFGPSLFLLGCVSPLLVRIAAREMKNIGRTVGGFYAVSTIGSVIGTALTGFVLIGWLGVNGIFNLVGILLCLLGLSYFLFARRIWMLAPLLLVLFLVPFKVPDTLPSVMSRFDQKVSLVAQSDSHYGSLKVIDYQDRLVHVRDMVIDGMVQGSVDVNTGRPLEVYPYFMTLLPQAYGLQINNALIIGLGAGMVVAELEGQGVRTDVVEIDPAVFDFAERYFNVQISGQKVAQDARYFLQQGTQRYDLVVLDVFSGDITPGHLVSLEALQLVNDRVADNGMLAINLIGDPAGENFVTASIVRTLNQVFDQVHVFVTADPETHRGITNFALLAYQGGPRELDKGRISWDMVAQQVRRHLQDNIDRRFELPGESGAIILTDDFNPVDVADLPVREALRNGILEYSEWDILGYSR